MRMTRRCWEPIALGLLPAVGAVLTQQPFYLLVSALVGALLLVTQVRFVHAVLALDSDLVVDQRADRSRLSTDDPVTVTLTASLAGSTPLAVEIATAPPLTSRIEAGEPRVTLEADTDVETTVEVSWPVAGNAVIPPPTVCVRDPTGWFRTTFRAGEDVELAVDPQYPRSMHVGQGGDPEPTTYGEHAAGRADSGITPAETRAYVPEDPFGRIDWKATARLGSLHIREFEAETDMQVTIALDHRASTGVGGRQGTALDYLRQVALAYVREARALTDPVGLVAVGDGGLTHRREAGATRAQYDWLRTTLLDVEPTAPAERTPTSMTTAVPGGQLARRLTGETALDRHVRPFLTDRTDYVDRIHDRPLFESVRGFVERATRDSLLVLLTDDAQRTEVRETAMLASRGEGRVMVFMTPTTLFAAEGLGDLASVHREYVAFEEFRRTLDRMDGVRAFEVAPPDQLHAVLASASQRRASA